MMTPKRLAALGLAAGLLAGGAAGTALGIPGLVGARTDESRVTTRHLQTVAESTPAEAPAPGPERGQWLQDALAPLVEKDTINQAQADAVIEALRAARPEHAKRPGPAGFKFGPGIDAAAEALGVTREELRTALQGGQSLADVARARNIDPQKVIDAIVAQGRERIAQGVTDGRITQAQADEMIARLTERTTAFVNGEGRGPGPGPGFRKGPRGPWGPPPAEATPSSGSTQPA